MSVELNSAASALAELGLDASALSAAPIVEQPAETVVVADPEVLTDVAAATEGEAAPAAAEEDDASFEVGASEELTVTEVPVAARSFGSTSTKYGFEHISAPTVAEDGKPSIHGKLVKFADGDKDKFKRSVQSGATAQNKKAKEAGAPNYYETRTHEVSGVFVGMAIYRTDNRPVEEAKTEAAAS